jgi:hypothetical protein
MYSVCGDESHDGKQERVFAVAGLFGSQEDWDAAEAAWVARTGGKVFHAADCESDKGDFAGIDHKTNLALYKDLTQIIIGSRLCGRGVALDLAGPREFFPDILPESYYHKCFNELLIRFGELAYLSIPQDKIEFTFDHRFETDYSAGLLYKYTTNQPEWKLFPYYHDEISFATRQSPRIQMADLIARETMKELDRQVGPTPRPTRRSMASMIAKPYRFEFTYYVREYFEDFRNKFAEAQKAAHLDIEDLGNWLRQMGLPDNWGSRLRYLGYLEANERLNKHDKDKTR